VLRLWLAAGLAPSPETGEVAGTLADAARFQGLAGLLHAAIARGESPWPVSVQRRLREIHRALLAHGIAQLDLVARVQVLLERAGIRSLPLKGAALAEAYYPTVADRPMSDVDLLVLDGWDGAVEALRGEGFRDVDAADHARAFLDPVSGTVLELHHSVCSCPGFYPLDREGLWARSRPAGGQVRRVPSIEDLLIHLSLHAAFQHGLRLSLVQYLDFRRLLEQTPPDVDRLLALAARSRAEAPLAVAVAAAEAVVGACPAPRLRDRLAPHVPRGLGAWLERIAEAPLSTVIPAVAPLLRVRWELARGRRGEWLRRTLAPPLPSSRPGRAWSLRAAVRGVTLAARWGPHAWTLRRRRGVGRARVPDARR
jgi:hypothetical protein